MESLALRVDRDEDGLHLRRQWPKLSERAGNLAERRRAQVRAKGIAEENQQPAAAQIDGADPVAAGIRYCERLIENSTRVPAAPRFCGSYRRFRNAARMPSGRIQS